MAQYNHHFSYTIAVNASLNKAWQHLIDVKSWHKWDTEIIEAKLETDFVVGAKGIIIPKTGPKLKFYISEILNESYYTINTIMPVGQLVIKRSLFLENNIVQFKDDIEFTCFLKYFFGFLLGSRFKKILPQVMNKFKQIVEN